MSSLLQLVEIRANKPKMNLLHFLVAEAERLDSSLCEFTKELVHLESVQKQSPNSIRPDVALLHEKVNRISTQVANCQDLDILREMDPFLEVRFLFVSHFTYYLKQINF